MLDFAFLKAQPQFVQRKNPRTTHRGEPVALYKYANNLIQSTDDAFDKTHAPGVSAPLPGIYRCTSCGDEIAIAGGHTLPPQNHRQHNPQNGAIQWKLIVYPVQQK